MIDNREDIERHRFPWARVRFELLGLLGAVAAYIVAVLLALIWDPLFWLGVIAMVVILLGTRQARRVPPGEADAIIAPVDGVVVSVEEATPPSELRLSGARYKRIRISSSPASINTIHAPMAGEITSLVEEAGEPSTPVAVDAEAPGLAAAYVVIGADGDQVGLRVAAGGLGPRLEMDVEPGDGVRLARIIGVRRLGGWCDVWLEPDMAPAIWPGMTVKAGETRLVAGAAPVARASEFREPVRDTDEPFQMPDLDEDEDVVSDDEAESARDHTAKAHEPDDDEDEKPSDPAEMFARLREKVSKADDTNPDEKKG